MQKDNKSEVDQKIYVIGLMRAGIELKKYLMRLGRMEAFTEYRSGLLHDPFFLYVDF